VFKPQMTSKFLFLWRTIALTSMKWAGGRMTAMNMSQATAHLYQRANSQAAAAPRSPFADISESGGEA